MKAALLALVLLSGLLFLAPIAPSPDLGETAQTLHEISIPDGACSSNAVGPHTLVTAAHCPLKDITVDDQHPKVKKTVLDGAGHAMLILEGIEFKHYVSLSTSTAKLGEHVYIFGNPLALELRNQYREGYLSGYWTDQDGRKMDVFQMLIAPGDSGSLIFAQDGTVVGMIDLGGLYFTYSFPLNFSPDQLKEIE